MFLRLTVSPIYCSLQPLHYITYITLLALQVILSLTLKILSLNETDGPSIKCLKRPHLGSLHLLTLDCSDSLLVNFALVSKRFKFGV